MQAIRKFRTSLRRITPDSIKEYPWLSIAIFLGVAWYILNKIGNSATWLGDIIRRFTSPDTVAIQEHKEKSFDSSNAVLGVANLQKVRNDAHSMSISMGTYKGSTWFNRRYFSGVFNWQDDSAVFDIIKQYTNKNMLSALRSAYASLYSDGRDLSADLMEVITSEHKSYLLQKGML